MRETKKGEKKGGKEKDVRKYDKNSCRKGIKKKLAGKKKRVATVLVTSHC